MKKPTREFVEAYNRLVAGLDLMNIRIVHSSFNLDHRLLPPVGASLASTVAMSSRYEHTHSGFTAFHGYRLELSDSGTDIKFGDITCEFMINYKTNPEHTMDDKLFRPFSARNLPLNTWPYMREFVDSVTSRMGLPRLVLPAFHG